MGRSIPYIPDSGPLVLDENEQEQLAVLNEEIAALQARRLAFLREAAKKTGLSALNIKDLQSRSGKPFVEEKSLRAPFGVAVVMEETPGGHSKVVEAAYLCQPTSTYLGYDPNTCGWVKGRPTEQSYNDIGPLSGSSGVRYFCKICGQQVGEHRAVMS